MNNECNWTLVFSKHGNGSPGITARTRVRVRVERTALVVAPVSQRARCVEVCRRRQGDALTSTAPLSPRTGSVRAGLRAWEEPMREYYLWHNSGGDDECLFGPATLLEILDSEELDCTSQCAGTAYFLVATGRQDRCMARGAVSERDVSPVTERLPQP